ncbi:MAG: sugar ABC transporter substrate-binding protein [Anaerolineaceae bacterium]|nr:sugar ABC transporter substrate-binding protein [Anaerolineaceae bacterium]
MKRLTLIIVLVMCASLALAACVPAASAPSAEPAKKLKVAVSINTYNNFHKVLYEAIQKYADANNIELQMVDAQGKADKQLTDVENLLASKPNGFILLPADATALGTAVDEIKKAGIPLVESSTFTKNENFDAFVGANDTMVGNIQGEYISSYLEKNPEANLKCGYLRILLGSPLDKARYEGLIEKVQKYIDAKRFEIIADRDGLATGDYSSSLSSAEDWMQAHPEMNCIIGQNDGTAVAALQAVIAAKRNGKVLVIGCDGEDPAISAIKDGNMSMTGLMQPAVWGDTAIKTLVDLMNGKKVEKFILIPPKIITSENAGHVSNFTYSE